MNKIDSFNLTRLSQSCYTIDICEGCKYGKLVILFLGIKVVTYSVNWLACLSSKYTAKFRQQVGTYDLSGECEVCVNANSVNVMIAGGKNGFPNHCVTLAYISN